MQKQLSKKRDLASVMTLFRCSGSEQLVPDVIFPVKSDYLPFGKGHMSSMQESYDGCMHTPR